MLLPSKSFKSGSYNINWNIRADVNKEGEVKVTVVELANNNRFNNTQKQSFSTTFPAAEMVKYFDSHCGINKFHHINIIKRYAGYLYSQLNGLASMVASRGTTLLAADNVIAPMFYTTWLDLAINVAYLRVNEVMGTSDSYYRGGTRNYPGEDLMTHLGNYICIKHEVPYPSIYYS
ncbi:hypothetical protein IJH29_00945 [Candidatus Saccharibacteria bacterium]|nr:hypothetical protein [Candidatus Saccharibacteria bacterium]